MFEAIIWCLQFNGFTQKGVRRLKLGMGAGQREELQVCPSGKQPTAHLPFKGWNSCTQISVETDLSTSPKISNTWECEKHQSQSTEMRGFKHQDNFLGLTRTQAGIHIPHPSDPSLPALSAVRCMIRGSGLCSSCAPKMIKGVRGKTSQSST